MKKQISIYAIDDDPDFLFILKRYLKKLSEWDIEFTGVELWNKSSTSTALNGFKILFIDYMVGLNTGITIIKKLRDQGCNNPIIMLTGQGNEEVAVEATKAGADSYLRKDDISEELLRIAIEKTVSVYEARAEQKILLERLHQSQKMETLGTLSGGIAHDFNNMLSIVMGNIEIATLNSSNTEVLEHLENATQGCMQMEEWVKNLLSFSRKEDLKRLDFDIVDLLNQTLEISSHTMSKSIKLEKELATSPMLINGVTSQIKQVVLNLITNASEAINGINGTIIIKTTICKKNEIKKIQHTYNKEKIEAKQYVSIEIKDSGTGIDPEIMEDIFQPFFTTKKLTEKKGTGLGLAMCWQIVEEHNGVITVDSNSEWTTFRLYFPLVVSSESTIETHASPSKNRIEKGSETILVVDDEIMICNLLKKSLEKAGYNVLVANDGLEAIDLFEVEKEHIASVLLDVSMPLLNGKDCIKQLKKIDSTIPVIFATGHDTNEIEEDLLALGAFSVTAKPIRVVDVAKQIRLAINSRNS